MGVPPESGRDDAAPGALVLASGSPQRRAILTTLGVRFRVRTAGVEEETRGEPIPVAVENARRKALAVARDSPAGTLVLGADTVIAVGPQGDGADPAPPSGPGARAVGKPADADEAAAMLRAWSGSAHHVASAVAIVRADSDEPEVLLADADTTLVRFRTLSAEDVDWYVGTGEWRDRAGGYAIQLRGSLLVEGIAGDWWTVVGLPVALLARRAPSVLR